MELFFASKIDSGTVRLSSEESLHCVKVLRHREGDSVEVIDGTGTLFHCTLLDADPREAVLRIDSCEEGWGALPYRLTLGICPTKNPDRFEWAVEKATEFGVDSIVPIIAERSERRVFKADRARRIALSATKQSLKALLPTIPNPVAFREFLEELRENHLGQQSASYGAAREMGVPGEPILPHLARPSATESPVVPVGVPGDFHEAGGTPDGAHSTPDNMCPADHSHLDHSSHSGLDRSSHSGLDNSSHSGLDPESPSPLRLIACCFDGATPRVSVREALEAHPDATDITVLIGPEGDFSPEEVTAAIAAGFIPVHLGTSRLRTETAAVAAAAFVYFHFI